MTLTDPPLLRQLPFRVGLALFAPADLRPSAEQRDRYHRFTRMGDPLADRLVEAFRRLPPGVGRAQFERALAAGIDAVDDPLPELVEFFAHVDAVPYWVSTQLLDRAHRATSRVGLLAGFTSLTMLSLMGGYLASRADKTLVATGDLTSAAPRRLAETLSWYVDVTGSGGLRRDGAGFASTVRVRLMHAMVRAGMLRRGDWDEQEWDHPINQSTLAGTLLLFSLGGIAGAQALGVPYGRADRRAVYHLWRYVGHLLGVHPDILPVSEEDTWRLMWIQADYEFRPDDDSRRLGQALAAAVGPILVGSGRDPLTRVARGLATTYLCSFSRVMLGDANADALGLPRSRFGTGAVLASAAVGFAVRYPLRLIPRVRQMREVAGRRHIEGFAAVAMRRHRGDSTYTRHDRLGQPVGAAR